MKSKIEYIHQEGLGTATLKFLPEVCANSMRSCVMKICLKIFAYLVQRKIQSVRFFFTPEIVICTHFIIQKILRRPPSFRNLILHSLRNIQKLGLWCARKVQTLSKLADDKHIYISRSVNSGKRTKIGRMRRNDIIMEVFRTNEAVLRDPRDIIHLLAMKPIGATNAM
ncbi:unnamed protein product [Albugo candida]|uniref:Uncharacterized protein n=1 Tax=Albugo candida TaxID=65357 RepID=A0A024G214_9STRA|nr:unnamed protein product [Albugo candida]CCI49988.1 unnamed protein product [Albugo candida]|eukprot:CCI40343.1 unnamed protein product [Albugo candida]